MNSPSSKVMSPNRISALEGELRGAMPEYDPSSFFIPDDTFVHWLVKYAAGRLIIDLGSGNGDVLQAIKHIGKYPRVVGVEPHWNPMKHMMVDCRGDSAKILQVLPYSVNDEVVRKMLEQTTTEALFICCRPCHNGFLNQALDYKNAEAELLYITKPSVWEKYDDLGQHRVKAVLLAHEGQGRDGELVWQIKG